MKALDSIDSVVPVLDVTSGAPCIEVGFENLRTEYIIRSSDVEPMVVIKCSLIGIRW